MNRSADSIREATSAQIIAGHVASLRYEDLGAQPKAAFKRALADYLACVLPGAGLPTPSLLRSYLTTLGETGVAGVYGTPTRLSAPSAAMANGAAAHALDFDDGHTAGSAHPGGVIMSATLALAEELGKSGRETLVAVVVGYEVMLRVSMAMHPASARRGWHNTAVAGVIGATASAAHLLKLDAEATRNALGLATSFAGGIREYLDDGAEVKRLHPGKAARDGIVCAQLAARGLTGAVDAFEGRHALFRVFVGDDGQPQKLVSGLGERYVIEDAYFKPYPCCRHFHSIIDGVLALRERDGIGIDDVESMTIGLYAVGKQGHDHVVTSSLLEAQMSAPFAAAAALKRGRVTISEFGQDARQDPDINRLLQHIDVVIDDECEAAYPAQRSGSLTVGLKSGRALSTVVRDPKGEGDNPLSDADIREKLRGSLDGSKLEIDCMDLWIDIQKFDEIGNVRAFVEKIQCESSCDD